MAQDPPAPETVNDPLEEFKTQDWSNPPAGSSTETVNLQAEASAGGETCPDGSIPQWVNYQLPNGTWAQKKICPGSS
jgi:hypothetical protein